MVKDMLKRIVSSHYVTRFFGYMYIICRSSYDRMIYSEYRRKYTIHPSFRFSGTGIIFYGDGDIIIGKNTYISRYGVIEACKGCTVFIGENCAIGPHVKIYTVNRVADQDLDRDFSNYERALSKGNVIIEDGCWIGSNVFIKEGIKIGKNSVIGMNSVVTREIPPHSIAVGCSARVVKFKSYISEKEKLEIIKKYWDTLRGCHRISVPSS